MNFGEKLKKLREDFGLTQEQLAQKVQLSKPNICKYEKGTVEPNIETMLTLSKIFDVTLDYLLGKSEIKNCSNSCISELDAKEEEVLGIFKKLDEEKQNKVIGFASALLPEEAKIINTPYKLVAFSGTQNEEVEPPIEEKTT